MLYILVGRHGRPSMELLHAWMREEGVECTLITQRQNKLYYKKPDGRQGKVNRNFVLQKNDILFRWGSRAYIDLRKEPIELNKEGALGRCSDKKWFRKEMMKNRGKVPFTVFSTGELHKISYHNGIIIRPDHHRAGLNYFRADNYNQAINIVNKEKSVPRGHFYASEAINKVAEYRVHMAFGKILVIKQKPAPENGDPRDPWNHAINEDDWNYIKWNDYNINIVKACHKAANIMGIDIAAFDVMVDNEGEVFILEANTAPTLSPYVINRLSHLFKGLIKGYINPSEFKELDSDNHKDYIWKNRELKIIKEK